MAMAMTMDYGSLVDYHFFS